ncbi:hypothetical protein BKA93DRAFT_755194 [Sparassis latifolia]
MYCDITRTALSAFTSTKIPFIPSNNLYMEKCSTRRDNPPRKQRYSRLPLKMLMVLENMGGKWYYNQMTSTINAEKTQITQGIAARQLDFSYPNESGSITCDKVRVSFILMKADPATEKQYWEDRRCVAPSYMPYHVPANFTVLLLEHRVFNQAEAML